MKTITIGRGDGCQIFIDDDLISRRHAILKISTFGKMEIVDMGKNGTFVNGIRLRTISTNYTYCVIFVGIVFLNLLDCIFNHIVSKNYRI